MSYFLIFFSIAFSQTFVEVNLTAGMQVEGHFYGKKKDSFGKNKPIDLLVPKTTVSSKVNSGKISNNQVVKISLPLAFYPGYVVGGDDIVSENQRMVEQIEKENQRYEESKKNRRDKNYQRREFTDRDSVDPKVRYAAIDRRAQYKDFFREVKISADFNLDPKDSSQNVFVNFIDEQIKEKKEVIPAGSGRYEMDYFNDTLNGSITIGYTMPQNTWAFRVIREESSGVLSFSDSRQVIHNAFNSHLPMNTLNKEYIFWGRPGTDVSFQFNFKDFSVGNNSNGAFRFRIVPLDFSYVASLSPEEIIKSIKEYADKLKANTLSEDDYKDFLTTLVYLHANAKLHSELFSALKSVDLMDLITMLNNDIGMFSSANINLWNIKAAATILSSELAIRFLNDIAPYCKNANIITSYEQTEVQVLGLSYANYFVEKALQRLNADNFSHYETLLKLLSNYEKRGLTKGQIRADKNAVDQLTKAYEVLINSFDMRISDIQAASDELMFVYNSYGTFGGPGADNQLIISKLNELKGRDKEFATKLLQRIREIQPNSNDRFIVSDLVAEVTILQEDVDTLINLIENKVSLAGLSGGNVSSSFVADVQQIILNMSNMTTASHSSFEAFRVAYFNQAELSKTLSGVNQCLIH